MGNIHYFCEGYALKAADSVNWQGTWLVGYNPTDEEADVAVTCYYEEAEPTTFSYKMRPHTSGNRGLHSLPEDQVRPNLRFGCKIVTSVPMIMQVTTGYYGEDDKRDYYTRAMHSVICATRLEKVHYYADGLILNNPGARLKEPEWDFYLNPNDRAANVKLICEFGPADVQEFEFTIPPCRVLAFFKDPVVRNNRVFGGKVISDIPIAVQQTRLIEEEDRKTIRSCYSVMALPAPLTVLDQSQLI